MACHDSHASAAPDHAPSHRLGDVVLGHIGMGCAPGLSKVSRSPSGRGTLWVGQWQRTQMSHPERAARGCPLGRAGGGSGDTVVTGSGVVNDDKSSPKPSLFKNLPQKERPGGVRGRARPPFARDIIVV